jgi:hypothetical protein
MFVLHVHFCAAFPCLCCMFMSMMHVHDRAACPYPFCMSMFMLKIHVRAACPCLYIECSFPWCMFMFTLHVHVRVKSILHVHVHAACQCLHAACPWIMFCLFVRLANFLESHICTFSRGVRDSRWYFRKKRFSLGIRFSQNNCETRLTENPSTNMKRQQPFY